MKNLKSFKQFLLESYSKAIDESYDNIIDESYHPGKEILIREITKEEALNFVSNTYAADKPEQNIIDLIQLNAEDEFEMHGAFEDDKLVGIVKFNDSHVEDYTEIHLLFVDPEYRNKNIGKMLIDYVKDNAEYKKLITNPYTDDAENFFKKLGFKIDSEIDPNDTNTMILENDNLIRSQSALDKFRMSNYDELPHIVQEACKKAGLKYIESYPYIDGFGKKNFVYMQGSGDIDLIIGMACYDSYKFDSNSPVQMYLAYEDGNEISTGFNILDERNNPKRILNLLNNMNNIIEKIQKNPNENTIKSIADEYKLSGKGFYVF